MSVGMPETLKLHEFGSIVWAAFGEIPFHVGSSVANKTWRDVDVRLILDDEEYERLGFGKPDQDEHHNERWVAFVRAFSALGREMTGLPIDFQIQQRTFANEKFSAKDGHLRSAIGMTPLRMERYKPS